MKIRKTGFKNWRFLETVWIVSKNKSIHNEFEGFLKQEGCLVISIRWYISQKDDLLVSVISML